jgi:hypothetical protein|tara:strand:+ start:314 stop:721 length:408 start_codon:yes stop_codon:yes gene_type:complete
MIKQLLNFLVLFILLTTPIRAQSLEIVFKDSIWGAGIGAAVGMASWALTEDHMAEDLRGRVVRGGALGALFGVGYGILEKEGVFGRLQNQTIPQAYVFEWDKKEKRITINPLSPLENLNENFNSEYCLGLLKVRF